MPDLESRNDFTDEQLMRRYQRGDVAAFETLFRRHRDPVFRYFLRGCSDRERAADLYQDVWASVVRVRATWQPSAKFTTWLYRLAHNRLVDEYRRAKIPTESLAEDSPLFAADSEQPDAQLSSQQRARRLIRAVQALPEEQREAFVLQQESGMSLEQIGEATGVGRETVKSRLRYALSKLRQELADVRV